MWGGGDKLPNCQIAFTDKKSGGDRLPLLYVMIQTGKLGLQINNPNLLIEGWD